MIFIVIGIVVVVAVGAFLTQHARNAADTGEEQGSDAASAGSGGFDEVLRRAEAEGSAADSLLLSRTETAAAPPVTAPKILPATLPSAPSADIPSAPIAPAAPAQPPAEGSQWGVAEEITPLKPILAATPISSPNALSSATYSSVAPPVLSGESPYAFGNTQESKSKPQATLLRWSGKTGIIQVGELSLHGPVVYWSEGASNTPEPSCIDISLPVEFPTEEGEPPTAGAASYAEMTPAQRGVYLLWLAEGRIQVPIHACYPMLWLFGLERRVLSDHLDISICIGEAFRLIPLIHWASLREGLIKFVTWMAAKSWLPEEQLLIFSRSLPLIPKEILCMLLRPYADAGLPLPSMIAFTVVRTYPFEEEAERAKKAIPPTSEWMEKFSLVYKSKCSGGLVLTRPKSSLFVAYVSSNPSLAGDKSALGGVLELPDFFRDITEFTPLIAAWDTFLLTVQPEPAPAMTAAEEIKQRPDWEVFVRDSLGLPEGNGEPVDFQLLRPIFTNLGVLGNLMGIELPEGLQPFPSEDPQPHPEVDGAPANDAKKAKKTKAADRKKIGDTAKVEGFLVLPDLGIAGKEYLWDDPVVLIPFPAGTRLSQDYNAAALLFEYSVALTALSSPEALTDMRKCFGDYFSLSPEDHDRLEVLSSVIYPSGETGKGPENIGECLQFWLNREERGVVRDFLTSFLANFSVKSGGEWEEGEWGQQICRSLDVERNDPPRVSFGGENPLFELGAAAGKILAPLFKD
ncbi:MAG: TerB N-terminal domain-containing protein [Synergistaceae bacterium]|nr:TerB N-terminal domain-containing protein [Synergistaceae bacterium]